MSMAILHNYIIYDIKIHIPHRVVQKAKVSYFLSIISNGLVIIKYSCLLPCHRSLVWLNLANNRYRGYNLYAL